MTKHDNSTASPHLQPVKPYYVGKIESTKSPLSKDQAKFGVLKSNTSSLHIELTLTDLPLQHNTKKKIMYKSPNQEKLYCMERKNCTNKENIKIYPLKHSIKKMFCQILWKNILLCKILRGKNICVP